MITNEDRNKIRESLPHGRLKQIAAKAEVNQVSVYAWFAGKFNSEKIEDAALEVYQECKAAALEKAKKLNDLD